MANNRKLRAGTRYYNFKTNQEPDFIRKIDERSENGEREAEAKYSNCSFTKDGARVWTF